VSIDEVRALVAERQRYDDWLSALDARQAETPERVFLRVRADYAQRREEVLARLHTHVDALAALAEELGGRLQQLDGEVEGLEDRRMEAMLRTAVGEYDGNTWDTLRDEVEAHLSRLTDERGSVQMELDEIRALLEQARPAASAPTPVEVVAEPVAELVAEPAVAPSVEALPSSSDAHASVHTPDDDVGGAIEADIVEVTMVEAVTVEPVTMEPVAIEPMTVDTTELAVEAVSETVDIVVVDDTVEALPAEIPLFFDPPAGDVDDALRLFAETPPTPAPVVLPPTEPVGFTAPELPPPPATPPSVRAVPPMPQVAPAADPFDDLAFLRSVTEPEQGSGVHDPLRAGAAPVAPTSAASSAPSPATDAPQKTLRCTECGTMNLPTEWYCERCGGELATF